MAEVLPQRYEPRVPLASLTLHPRNPNKGNVAAIAGSIAANGFAGALLVQEGTNYILAGNHTSQAAGDQQLAEVPVIYVNVPDDDRAEALMIALNHIGRMAEWDNALLLDLLEARDTLEGTGFEQDALDALAKLVRGAAPDDFPQVDDLATEFRCPRCGYEWSGKSKPAASAEAEE